MKPRDYCCCAIPVVYAGIYTALLEQFVLGIVAGTLSIATPSSEHRLLWRPQAAHAPYSCWRIYAVFRKVDICDRVLGSCSNSGARIHRSPAGTYKSSLCAALLHIGMQERPIFFRRYVTLNLLATVGAFGVGAAWIILSATRHNQAQSQCLTDFFGNTVSANNSEGQTLCNIFPWADVGIMGGLWVLFAIVQVSFMTHGLALERTD